MQDTQGEPLFADRVAGLDIATAGVEVTIRVPSDTAAGRRQQETRTFATTRRELESPQVRQSVGKRKGSNATGRGNPYLGAVLGEATSSAGRTQSFLGAKYRRLTRRMPDKRPWSPQATRCSPSSTPCYLIPKPATRTSARVLRTADTGPPPGPQSRAQPGTPRLPGHHPGSQPRHWRAPGHSRLSSHHRYPEPGAAAAPPGAAASPPEAIFSDQEAAGAPWSPMPAQISINGMGQLTW